ncbi:MAG: DivIVA domain-containing protein [Merdibacter sp.]
MAQNFDRMKDGYNRSQVDSAIEELNMRIDSLERVNEAYRLRCTQLEEQIRHLQSIYDPAFQNLRQKEDAASQMVAIAMKEANTIVATAKQNADVIISEALLDARELLADITHLAQETQDAKERCSGRHSGSPTCSMNSRRWHFQNLELPDKQRALKKTCPLIEPMRADGWVNLWWRPTGITSETDFLKTVGESVHLALAGSSACADGT